jgi:hypothetical protein
MPANCLVARLMEALGEPVDGYPESKGTVGWSAPTIELDG